MTLMCAGFKTGNNNPAVLGELCCFDNNSKINHKFTNYITHSCLENFSTSIVWMYDVFVNNFAIKYT